MVPGAQPNRGGQFPPGVVGGRSAGGRGATTLPRGTGAATHRLVLDRYPFTVFYRPTDDGVMVIAVAHQRRRPNYWKSR